MVHREPGTLHAGPLGEGSCVVGNPAGNNVGSIIHHPRSSADACCARYIESGERSQVYWSLAR